MYVGMNKGRIEKRERAAALQFLGFGSFAAFGEDTSFAPGCKKQNQPPTIVRAIE
jgi:hypothetical protein